MALTHQMPAEFPPNTHTVMTIKNISRHCRMSWSRGGKSHPKQITALDSVYSVFLVNAKYCARVSIQKVLGYPRYPRGYPGERQILFPFPEHQQKRGKQGRCEEEKNIREWQQTRDNLVNLIFLVFCRTFIIQKDHLHQFPNDSHWAEFLLQTKEINDQRSYHSLTMPGP